MDKSSILMLFGYHFGMYDRVWDCVMDLTTDQFIEESDYSFRSVRNQLDHCINVDDRWVARLRLQTPPALVNPTDYADQASLRSQWNIIRKRVLSYVDDLTAADLDETIPAVLPDRFASPRHSARRQILLRMVNHGTDHRAQILARLFELGAETVEQDLILYLWNEAGP